MPAAAEPVVLVASSEFTLKSLAVRLTLEQRLIDDLKFALRRENLAYSRVEKEAARFVIFGTRQADHAAAVCRNVFGVAYAAPAILLTEPTLDSLLQTILELAERGLASGRSFAIRAHRSTPGNIARREVEVQGGSLVLSAFRDREIRVDLDEPDLTIYVDLVGSDAFVYSRKLNGPGGLPISAQWKMLAVLDSGAISVLAALAMMRRGCVVELFIPVSNKIGLLSSERQLPLAQKIGRLATRPSYKAFVMTIDESPLREHMAENGWRDLVRASAVKFAQKSRFKGLVFGDISGDLISLNSYSGLSPLPIFYPLLGLEEEDLADLLRLGDLERGELTVEGDKPYATREKVRSLFDVLPIPSVNEVCF